MSNNNDVIAYKINSKGKLVFKKFDEILPDLISGNIILFYQYSKKRLYIWIGKASENVGSIKYLPPAKEKISRDYRILRYFTIDEGNETHDFLSLIRVTDEELENSREESVKYAEEINAKISKLEIEKQSYVDSGLYDKAIELARDIVGEADKLNNIYLIDEQKAFMREMRKKKSAKREQDGLSDKIDTLNEFLAQALKNDDYEKSHEMAEELRELKDEIDNKSINIDADTVKYTQNLLEEEEKVYGIYLDKETSKESEENELELQKEIGSLQNEVIHKIDAFEFDEALSILDKIDELSKHSSDEDFKTSILDFNTEKKQSIVDGKIILELKGKIEPLENQIKTLEEEKKFDESLQILEETLESYKKYHGLEKEIEHIERLKTGIITEKEDYGKNLKIFSELERNVKKYEAENKLNAALQSCKQIIIILPKIGKEEDITHWQQEHDRILKLWEEQEKIHAKERNEMLRKAGELENIISSQEGVMPNVEDFNMSDLIGDLSDDVDQMLNQLGGLLNEHRVEVKKEITSTSLLRSVSGEIMQLETVTEVTSRDDSIGDRDDKNPQPVTFTVNSGLTNPFDDIIEEAILEDIIPYNFKISEYTIDGEQPSEKPEEILEKDGLKLKWTLNDIEPNKSVEINYNLEKRVSRTIIIPMDEELKIITTHGDVKELERTLGLYNAELSFSNNFKRDLRGVVIEDIVPLIYICRVRTPKDLNPLSQSDESKGELIKWNFTNFNQNQKTLHDYNLIGIIYYEDLKINIHGLNSEALNQYIEGNPANSLEIYQKIQNTLKLYELS